MYLIIVPILFFSLIGCVTKPTSAIISSSVSCPEQLSQARTESFVVKLNSLSVLYSRGCYSEVISLGSELRIKNRDKYYSLIDEATEAIAYEGTLTEYTLDSHERIFLSILISVSYLKKGDTVSAEVELKRAYEESIAQIYRNGTDEVNVFLQGLMWLQLAGWSKAEPFFKSIEETSDYSAHLKIFVKNLKSKYQRNKKTAPIQVYTINHMPKVTFEWFSIYSKEYHPEISVKNCLSEDSIIISTLPWVNHLERREDFQNDPILTAKRVIRLPATLLYSGTILLAGGALTYASAGSEAAPYIATLTLYFTYRTFVNGLAPDMRSWGDLPEAFYVGLNNEDPSKNICLYKYPMDTYKIEEFFRFNTRSQRP